MLLLRSRSARRRLASGASASAHHPPSRSFNALTEDPINAPLARDVVILGRLLGAVLTSRTDVLPTVEGLRKTARLWREADDASERDSLFSGMVEEIRAKPPRSLLDVTRAFAHFLALANAAEVHHRIRRLNEMRPAEGL